MAVASVVPATPARAVTIVNDTFDVPAGTATRIDDAADPLDVAWWNVGTGTPAHATDNGSPGIGTDRTIVLDANPTMVANFSDVTLGSIGDWVKLSFDMRWIIAAPEDVSYRFGLFNSNGTVVTADSGTEGGNDTGYWALIEALNPSAVATKDGTGGILSGPGLDSGSVPGVANLPHLLELLITKENATQMRVAVSVDGTEAVTGLDANINTSTFNEIAVKNLRGSGGDLHLDNVQVTTNVPEPSTIVLLAMGGVIMLGRRR